MGRLTLRRRLLLALLGAFRALTPTTVVFPARMSGEQAPPLRAIAPGDAPILPVFSGTPGSNGEAITLYPTPVPTPHAV